MKGDNFLKTWEEIKANISSLSEEEKEEVEIISNMVARIIEKRIELGLTQEELADLAGLEQSVLAKLETLRYAPSHDTIRKIFKVLDSIKK